MEAANAFLRQRCILEFNRKFTVAAREKSTAFRRTGRSDLGWIFTVQTERIVAQDNTWPLPIAAGRLTNRYSAAPCPGCTVTIHEHLDGQVSIRYGLQVVGRHDPSGGKRRGKPTASAAAISPPKLTRRLLETGQITC